MKIKTLLVAILVALTVTPRPVQAVHGMVIGVEATRITIGTDTVPRFLDLPNTLIVAAGQTVTLAADSTWDYIEVAGTLRCDPTRDTRVRYIHLFVLPHGTIECASATSPLPAARTFELIGRDVPVDLTRDPFQWGNGLLVFGTRNLFGAPKATWGPLAAAAVASTRTLVLGFDPQGWQIGDVLEVTDTATPRLGLRPRRESGLAVATLDGRTVTLSAPLAFDHRGITDPDGVLVLQPRVANLTRNIIIRSENPAGTPSHAAMVGADAHWTTRYVQFVGLGRTMNRTLNSLVDNTPGTNQVGRYEDHHHHAFGFGSSSVGNAYIGGAGKWGHVLHGTHDVVTTDNVAVGFSGAGFVTEDGYEVRDVYQRNFSAFNLGAPTNNINAEAELTGIAGASVGCPGCTGNGFWWRGIGILAEGNEAWNNHIGINFFNQNTAAGMSPSQPGGEHDTTFVARLSVPLNVDGNVSAANESTNVEYWGAPQFLNKNLIAANPGVGDFFQGQSDNAAPSFVNPIFVCQDGQGFGMHAGTAYVASLTTVGGRVVGCEYGLKGGGAQIVTRTDTIFQNVINFDHASLPLQITDTRVLHKPLGMRPPQYWVLDPKPSEGVSEWFNQRGSQLKIISHQGVVGQDFRVFVRTQLASTPAPYSTGPNYPEAFNQPEAGITMGQSWAKYGMAYRGEALADGEAVILDGFIHAPVHPGLVAPLGPPRAIVTTPNSREAATIREGQITVWATLTGEVAAADDVLLASVDGGPDLVVAPRGNGDPRDLRTFTTTAVAQGTHEIRTWRRADGQKIAASLMTFTYPVGTIQPPPVCTPPKILVGGVCVDPPPPVETWIVLVGTVGGGRIEQLQINTLPQPRYRICSPGVACVEFVFKP